MEDRVSVSMAEGVADVRMVRADKMNALDIAMFDALCDLRSAQPREGLACGSPVRGGARVLRRSRHQPLRGHEETAARARDAEKDLAGPDPRNRQFSAIRGLGMARTACASHRGGPRRGVRRRLPARARGRHAVLAPDARMSIMEIKWGWCRTWRERRSWQAWCATISCAN